MKNAGKTLQELQKYTHYLRISSVSRNLYSISFQEPDFKACVRYIFACVFCKSKSLANHFEIFFRSRDNQTLTFQIFRFYDVIKCPSRKHETHFTE